MAAGDCGSGVSLSGGIGAVMSDLLVDGKSDIELSASAENEISGLFEKQESYQEIPFSVSNLPEFTSFAVMVVMNSDNPSSVPKLQDLRAVASF